MVEVSTNAATPSVKVTVDIEQRKDNILLCYFDDMGVDQCRKYDSIFGAEGYVGTETDLFNKGVYANTPNLDAFHNGATVQFYQARSNPVCSPTRAGMYSGRYASRTGVGSIIALDRGVGGVGNALGEFGVDVAAPGAAGYVQRREYVLAEIAAAAGYQSGFFGKWHLDLWGGTDATVDPLNTVENTTTPGGTAIPASGWSHLDSVGKWTHWWAILKNAGTKPQPYNGVSPYGSYGVATAQGNNGGYYARAKGDAASTLYNGAAQYLDKVKVQKALEWMNDPANQPWVCVVAFNLPHAPFHDAALAGYTVRSVYTNQYGHANSAVQAWAYYGSMREAVDVEFGNLVNGITASIKSRTNIFVTSDNGTEIGILKGVKALYDDVGNPTIGDFGNLVDKSKGTVYNLGSWVPLWVQGPACAGTLPRTSPIPVDIHVDLFETFRNIMHVPYSQVGGSQPTDGTSILPALQNSNHGIDAHTKKHCLVEYFKPNGDPDDVDSQGLLASEVRRERAFHRYIRSGDGYTGNAAGLYSLLRIYSSTTKLTTEEFYRIGTSAGSPASSDWDQQTNIIADSNFSGQLAIVRADMDALLAEFA